MPTKPKPRAVVEARPYADLFPRTAATIKRLMEEAPEIDRALEAARQRNIANRLGKGRKR
jgi:diadenosine tetraphosphate (Ap4A) HIT family hydrolase